MGFVQANELRGAERWLICSGQTSMDADGNPLHPGDMNAQLVQALDNLETVLHAANFEMSDIVRLNVYTTDIDRFMQALPAVGNASKPQDAALRAHSWASPGWRFPTSSWRSRQRSPPDRVAVDHRGREIGVAESMST